MKGWIIYRQEDAKRNHAFIDWFIDECNKQNIELTLIHRESLTFGIMDNQLAILLNNKVCQTPDFTVMRTIDPLLSKQLEQMGVLAFNSSEISLMCNNKAYTHQAMNQLGIPMVDSLFVKKDFVSSKLPHLLPFVVKTVGGKAGNNVSMIHTNQDWQAFANQPQQDDLVIQSCDVQLGKDLRVFVVGKEIVGAVLRSSSQDFRANYSLGGNADWYELSDSETAIVKGIINHFDFGMVGVDFLFDKNGNLLFNEIEDVVGSRTLSKVSDVNIVRSYVDFIKQQLS